MRNTLRALNLTLILAVALGLGACNRRNSTDREEPAARQAGRTAYQLRQDIKKDAREVADKLRKAGKEAQEGWNEAKHEDPSNRKEKQDQSGRRKEQK